MIARRRGIACPACGERPVPYWAWTLWPGPVIRCRRCNASLRLLGFWRSLLVQLVLATLWALCSLHIAGLLSRADLTVVDERSAQVRLGVAIYLVVALPALLVGNLIVGWYRARYEVVERAP